MAKKISEQEGALLLKLAKESIRQAFEKQEQGLASLEAEASKNLLEENRGVFVSLHKKGDLRGCIGNIEPVKTIFMGVVDNARQAAFNDSRFRPLSKEELRDTTIEVSILTRPETLAYTDGPDLIKKLRPNLDGVIIKKHHKTATFLPQVWKQLKDPASFLSHLCTKAGLPAEEWKSGNLSVSTYQVQVFEQDH